MYLHPFSEDRLFPSGLPSPRDFARHVQDLGQASGVRQRHPQAEKRCAVALPGDFDLGPLNQSIRPTWVGHPGEQAVPGVRDLTIYIALYR